MESHTNSFHLQTPFITKDFNHPEDDTSRISRNVFSTNIKSESFPGEGTFAEVLEYNKHLTALRDLEVLKNQYYEDYVTNLEKKVKQQRKVLTKSEDRDVSHDAQTLEPKTSPRKKGKLPHHKVRHDKEYMRKVTKSKFYHFLAARDLMQKRGLIKNKTDEDNFWNRVIQDNRIWSQPINSGIPSDALTRVMVHRFSSMSTHKRSNHKDDHHVKFGDTSSTYIDTQKDKLDTSDTDSDKVRDQTLKKLQVKMKLPKLHSMRNITPLPEIQSSSHDIADSSKKLNRLKKLRSTKHAYDVAMVHHAATRRMLREHSIPSEKESEFILHDMVTLPSIDSSAYSPFKQQRLEKREEEKTFITEPVYGHDQVLIPELEYKYSSARKKVIKSNTTQKKQDNGENSSLSLAQQKEEQSATPLNFSMMLEQGQLNVKKPRALHTFWVNYADDM